MVYINNLNTFFYEIKFTDYVGTLSNNVRLDTF